MTEIEMEKMVSGALIDCNSDGISFYMSLNFTYIQNFIYLYNEKCVPPLTISHCTCNL